MRSALHSRNGPARSGDCHHLDRVGFAARRSPGRARCARSPSAAASLQRAAPPASPRRRRRPEVSLFASATVRPASTAAKVGSRSGGADDRGDYKIGFTQRRLANRFRPRGRLDAGAGEPSFEIEIACRIGHRGKIGAEFRSRTEQAPRRRVPRPPRRRRTCPAPPRSPVRRSGRSIRWPPGWPVAWAEHPAASRETAGAPRKQDEDCSPLKQPACDERPVRVESGDQRGEHRRGHEGVKPVHQTAVPRDEVAQIFDPKASLECEFEEIAEFGDNRRREPEPE